MAFSKDHLVVPVLSMLRMYFENGIVIFPFLALIIYILRLPRRICGDGEWICAVTNQAKQRIDG